MICTFSSYKNEYINTGQVCSQALNKIWEKHSLTMLPLLHNMTMCLKHNKPCNQMIREKSARAQRNNKCQGKMFIFCGSEGKNTCTLEYWIFKLAKILKTNVSFSCNLKVLTGEHISKELLRKFNFCCIICIIQWVHTKGSDSAETNSRFGSIKNSQAEQESTGYVTRHFYKSE